MLVRSRAVDADLSPSGVAVICYDGSSARWSMGYHDDRGVSRLYDMTFDGRRRTFAGKPQDFLAIRIFVGNAIAEMEWDSDR